MFQQKIKWKSRNINIDICWYFSLQMPQYSKIIFNIKFTINKNKSWQEIGAFQTFRISCMRIDAAYIDMLCTIRF